MRNQILVGGFISKVFFDSRVIVRTLASTLLKVQGEIEEMKAANAKERAASAEERAANEKERTQNEKARTASAKEVRDLKTEIRSLKTEIQGLNVANEDLEAIIESNKDEIANLKKETVQIRSDARVQTAKLEEELRKVRDSISTVECALYFHFCFQFSASLRPLRLRILLDFARSKIVAHSQAESWDVLRNEEDVDTFRDRLYALLAGDPYRPTKEALLFLCSPNNIRKEGNNAAHQAEKDEIAEAIAQRQFGLERTNLEGLFEYTFNEKYI